MGKMVYRNSVLVSSRAVYIQGLTQLSRDEIAIESIKIAVATLKKPKIPRLVRLFLRRETYSSTTIATGPSMVEAAQP